MYIFILYKIIVKLHNKQNSKNEISLFLSLIALSNCFQKTYCKSTKKRVLMISL